MQLNAQMAVLSACNTGLGKIQQGEGVMSLGRAFAYAGVQGIIMEPLARSGCFDSGYHSAILSLLQEGRKKDQALREAKLQYLDNANARYSHPFYWAGFVAQGDASPLEMRTNRLGPGS